MDDTLAKALVLSLLAGLVGTIVGCWQCISGHNYAVAAQHQSTTVGRVVRISSGKGGPYYHYVFTVNGVAVDDLTSDCRTPLAPGACDNLGPVLVYYSYQPFAISKLQDFTSASNDAYRFGEPALAIGLPLFVLSIAALVVLSRKGRFGTEPDPGDQPGASKSGGMPDDLHIAPGE